MCIYLISVNMHKKLSVWNHDETNIEASISHLPKLETSIDIFTGTTYLELELKYVIKKENSTFIDKNPANSCIEMSKYVIKPS